MALVGTYTYEEGVAGATVAAGNGVVSVAGTPTYSTADAVHQTLGVRAVGTSYLRYASPSQTHSGSVFMTPRVYTTAANYFVRWLSTTTSSEGAIRLNAAGQVVLANASNVSQATSTLQTTAGTRYRLDWDLVASGLNVTGTVRIFADTNVGGTTPTETITASWVMGAAHTYIGVGSVTTGWTLGFDTLRLYNTVTSAGPFTGVTTTGTVAAGNDQLAVEPGSTVTITAATTGTGTLVWSQTAGTPTVTLSGSGVSRTFFAPGTWDGTTLTFQAAYGGDTDNVDVTILPHNRWRKVSSSVWTPLYRIRNLTDPPAPVGYVDTYSDTYTT